VTRKNKIIKNSLIAVIFLFLATVIIWKIALPLLVKPPRVQNFILLSIDDLRADRLGCYGNPRNVSPFLDQLAEQGTQFLNAFISWPFTPRSHASMLTSYYPAVFDIPLDPNIQTIGSVFSDYKYKTAAFTEGGWMSASYGVLNGFQEYDDKVQGVSQLKNKVKKWLKKNQNKKFFLFLHTYCVHRPFVAPPQQFKKFADPNYSGPIKNNSKSTNAFIKAANAGRISVSPEDIQRLLDIYDSQIILADEFVFSIVETLKKLNLDNKTMLIITADHGEQFYEYKHFGHVSKFNPFADISTRVPLIIYCPLLPRKGKVDQMVEIVDLAPTIFEAAGLEKPKISHGESFFPVLCGKPSFFIKKKKEIYYCNLYFLGIRTKKLKLILDLGSGETKLFDLIKDPAEKNNIIQEYSTSIVKSLVEKVRNFQEESEGLRRKLNISQVKLAEGLPSRPLSFDDHTVLLASFDYDNFFYKKKDSVNKTKIEVEEPQLVEGRYGRGLLLQADKKINFPLETPILGEVGSIEFWIKLHQPRSRNQRFLQIYLDGEASPLSIEANIFWNWEEQGKRGISFKLTKPNEDNNESDLNFSKNILWNAWHHVLIAWEQNEVFLIIDGISSSRRKILAGNFFDQTMTDSIRISGQNCIIDDLRVSDISRLFRPSSKKKVKLDPKVIEKLKALGYIN